MNSWRKRVLSLFILILTISQLQTQFLLSDPEYGYTKNSEIEKIGQVNHVYDGDTFRLSDGVIVRLADIDAPESNEQGYSDSTEALKAWILGKEVYLDIDDVYVTDGYGRLVCVVYVPRYSSFINVNKALIQSEDAEETDFSNEFDPDDWRYLNHDSYLKQARKEHNQVEEEAPQRDDFEEPDPPTITRFVASSKSDKYHTSKCHHAKRIKQENIRAFSTSTQAENEDYSPCKVCLTHLQPEHESPSLSSPSEPDPERSPAPDPSPEPTPPTEPEPEPEPESPSIPSGSYVGSKKSDKYHKPSCYHVDRILPENLRIFSSKSAATSAGYVPCKICLPEQQPEPEPDPEPEPTTRYVASKSSEVFHHTWCSYVDQIKSSNKVYFSSRNSAVNSGRRPCSRCDP